MTPSEREALSAVAKLLHEFGASEVFVFGSAVTGELRPDSDIDMAVSGLPPRVYFSAVSQASNMLGRLVDLVDLDDDSPRIQFLRASGDLVRVG